MSGIWLPQFCMTTLNNNWRKESKCYIIMRNTNKMAPRRAALWSMKTITWFRRSSWTSSWRRESQMWHWPSNFVSLICPWSLRISASLFRRTSMTMCRCCLSWHRHTCVCTMKNLWRPGNSIWLPCKTIWKASVVRIIQGTKKRLEYYIRIYSSVASAWL